MAEANKTLIVHGWTTQLDSWTPLSDWLKQAGIETETLHVPGLSSVIKRPWNLDDYTLWLKDIVEKEGAAVNIIAHSNGGRIALSLARTNPELINKLVLIDSAGLPRKELKLKIKRTVFKALATIGKKFSNNQQMRKLLYKLARERDYLEASPMARQTMANLLAADEDFDTSTPINVNSLLIWGKEDAATPVKDAYVLGEILQPSRLHIIDDARHSPHRTHTEVVGKSIADFIKEDL